MTNRHLWSIIGVMFALVVSLVGYVFAGSGVTVREHGMELARHSTRIVIVEQGQAEIIRRLGEQNEWLKRIDAKLDKIRQR